MSSLSSSPSTPTTTANSSLTPPRTNADVTKLEKEELVKKFLTSFSRDTAASDTRVMKYDHLKSFCVSENVNIGSFKRMKRKVICNWWYLVAISECFVDGDDVIGDVDAITAARKASSFDEWYADLSGEPRSNPKLGKVVLSQCYSTATKKIKVDDLKSSSLDFYAHM